MGWKCLRPPLIGGELIGSRRFPGKTEPSWESLPKPKTAETIRTALAMGQPEILQIWEKEDIFKATLWGGLQRNLRIMGTLTELYIFSKRAFRMKDLPQIVSNTALLSKELKL